ncbi:MAG: phage-shock protein [Paenibacillus sp.]|jgi:phage shock protein PspC (stress-responsive transcriptional regulator)|nr:phage-shock protein [Paenibacillus sp.]
MTKLYRSRTDSKLFGLCGGLAQMINVDSTLLRVIVVVTAFFSGGTVIPLYFIACLVIPKEPDFDFPGGPAQGPYANGPYSNPASRNSGSYGQNFGQSSNTGSFSSSKGNTAGYQQQNTPAGHNAPPKEPTVDEMMRDMEKKMLQREIDELRAKVAQYEQQKNRQSGNEEN